MSSPSSTDLAGVGLDQPEQRLDQLGLAVALDAGDAEHLAGAGLERDVLDDLVAARVDDRDARGPPARRAPAWRPVLVDLQLHLAADHHLGQLGLGGGRRRGADDLAAPDHA